MFWGANSKQSPTPPPNPPATSSTLSPAVVAEAGSHAVGAEGVSSSYGGDRMLGLRGFIYSWFLERILWPIKLQIQEQVCGFLAVRQWSGSLAPQACRQFGHPVYASTLRIWWRLTTLDSFGVPRGRILWCSQGQECVEYQDGTICRWFTSVASRICLMPCRCRTQISKEGSEPGVELMTLYFYR